MGKCAKGSKFLQITLKNDRVKFIDNGVEVFNETNFLNIKWNRSRFIDMALYNLSVDMKQAQDEEEKGENKNA